MIFPKFTAFSWDEPKPKNEATYEEWKYEVICTLKAGTYTEDILAQAMRKSLQNQAKSHITSRSNCQCRKYAQET